MSFKDILAPLLSVGEDDAALSAAEVIAEGANAKITALLLEIKPPPIHTIEGAGLEFALAEAMAHEHKAFAAEQVRLATRAAKASAAVSTRALAGDPHRLGRELAAAARCADLTVMLRPLLSAKQYYRVPLFEQVLFGSGRPVLLVPPAWTRGAIGRNVIVAWNGMREAARALADAAPLLDTADQVEIVVAGRGAGDLSFDHRGADDVVAHLGRRGVAARWRGVETLGRNEGIILLEDAASRDADLLVLGGYGRSRLGEAIFGGVTREVIQFAETPLFMSH